MAAKTYSKYEYAPHDEMKTKNITMSEHKTLNHPPGSTSQCPGCQLGGAGSLVVLLSVS